MPPPRSVCLLAVDAQQLHLEDQSGAGRNDAGRPAVAIAQMRGDDEPALAAYLHGGHALVPALDDAAPAQREGEGLAAVHRAVELGAILEPAGVVHGDRVTGGGLCARALDPIHVAEAGSGLYDLLVHWVGLLAAHHTA